MDSEYAAAFGLKNGLIVGIIASGERWEDEVWSSKTKRDGIEGDGVLGSKVALAQREHIPSPLISIKLALTRSRLPIRAPPQLKSELCRHQSRLLDVKHIEGKSRAIDQHSNRLAIASSTLPQHFSSTQTSELKTIVMALRLSVSRTANAAARAGVRQTPLRAFATSAARLYQLPEADVSDLPNLRVWHKKVQQSLRQN